MKVAFVVALALLAIFGAAAALNTLPLYVLALPCVVGIAGGLCRAVQQ